MIAMAALNAVLNLVCLRLLRGHHGGDLNFKASAVFTNNDSLVNGAIVLAVVLLMGRGSSVPDLILGIVVAVVAGNGGREILKDAGKAERTGGRTTPTRR